jgi:hypothetical protein
MCQIDKSMRPWDAFFNNIMRTQVWFAMSLVAWGNSSVMCRISSSTCNEHWIIVLRKVLLATIPAAATFYAEDIIMEIIITFQAAGMGKERHLNEIMRRRNAMFFILSIYLEDKDKKAASQEPPVNSPPVGGQGSRYQFFASRLTSITGKFFGTLYLRDPPDPNNEYEQGKRYVQGKGNDKEFDRSGKPLTEIIVGQWLDGESVSLTEVFRPEKLDEGAGKNFNSKLEIIDKGFTAEEIMTMVDTDDSGDVTTDEVTDFLKELVMAMRDIAKSVNGMKCTARSANAVVCFLLLFVVTIIYGMSSTSPKS